MVNRVPWRAFFTVGMMAVMLSLTYSLTQGVLAQNPPPTRNTPTPTVPSRFTPTPTSGPTSESTPPASQTPPLRHTPTPTSLPPPPRSTPTSISIPPPTKKPPPSAPCYAVRGQLVSLTGDQAPSARVLLAGYDWSMERELDAGGHYVLECLGQGIGLLNPVLPPGYTPLTTDVALRIGNHPTWHINLGYYSGPVAPLPPVPLGLTAEPQAAIPGEQMALMFRAQNSLSQPLTDAWMTLLLPDGQAIVDVQVASGSFEIWQNLLTVDLGELVPSQTVTVQIALKISPEASPDAYRELVASFGYHDGVTWQTTHAEAWSEKVEPPRILPITGATTVLNSD